MALYETIKSETIEQAGRTFELVITRVGDDCAVDLFEVNPNSALDDSLYGVDFLDREQALLEFEHIKEDILFFADNFADNDTAD